MAQISELFIYPVKSLQGISLKTSDVTTRGLKWDRRWMLVDSNYKFLTQRNITELAKFKVEIDDESSLKILYLKEEITFLLNETIGETLACRVWDDEVLCKEVSKEVSEWFTNKIGFDCKLVKQLDDFERKIDPNYAINQKEHTSLSDAYPILIISKSSLRSLNDLCPEYMDMRRFRPNIVLDDVPAFFEDSMAHFNINEVKMVGVKPCARCVLTTIHPDTLEKSPEPLLSLSKFRKNGNKILFGQNVVVHQEGSISVGDKLIF
jgi:uncharacterized protein YcbX